MSLAQCFPSNITKIILIRHVYHRLLLALGMFVSIFMMSANAQEDFIVRLGEDKVFKEFNYHNNWFEPDPNNPEPAPFDKEAFSSGNVARVHVRTPPGYSGVAMATLGVNFTWDLKGQTLQQVYNQPVDVIIRFSKKLTTYYGRLTGSANAGVHIHPFALPWYRLIGYEMADPPDVEKTITNTCPVNEKYPTTIGKLGHLITFLAYSQAHRSAPRTGGDNYSSAEIQIESIVLKQNGTSTANDLISPYYESILGRCPEPGGFVFWDGEIARMQNLGIDVQEVYRVMAGWFFNSPEYLIRDTSDTQYVTNLYRAFFQRDPDAIGLTFWLAQMNDGMPRNLVLFSFLFAAEFEDYMQGLLGDTASRGEVYAVVDFYRGFLNRLPDTRGFDYWLGRFRVAQCQDIPAIVAEVESISRQFLASAEYTSRNRSNRDYVADLYYAFLRRGGELGGFDYWVNQLDSGARSREQLREEFLNSPEFQGRVQQIINQGCLL